MHVAVVGVGGAGNNLLNQAIDRGMNPKNCVAVNTDRGQLSESPAQNKVLLADNVGNGTQWSRQAPGSLSVLAHRVTPFTRESDFTILLTGLGGVTGTKTAPVIAQLHRSQVRPVVSVVALPFIHERERRFVALRGLKRMIEACDCTVVVDNSIQKKAKSSFQRVADEMVASAVRTLSDVVAMGNRVLSRRVLNVLSLGHVATVCIAPVVANDEIQSAVIDALGTPSARLPLSGARGAVVVFRGPEPLGTGLSARAYETIAYLAGHDLEFVQVNLQSPTPPSVSIFLTGYSYGTALGGFVDLIQDLYDVEYGQESSSAEIGLPIQLYQMESS